MKASPASCVFLLLLATDAQAQTPDPQPPRLDRLALSRVAAVQAADIRTAIDDATKGYAAAAQVAAQRPNVAEAVLIARDAAQKAEQGLWGYGIRPSPRRYAGVMAPDGMITGTGVTDEQGTQGMRLREATAQFGRVTTTDGGFLAGEVTGTPHPIGEFEGAGGLHYLGGYSALWLPFTYEGYGVLSKQEDGQSVRYAGWFMRGKLTSGVRVAADGSLSAGRWLDERLAGHGAQFGARGNLLSQGLYILGERRADLFDHPAKGLTAPVPVRTPGCNDNFFPPISRRLNEHDTIAYALIVKADGSAMPMIMHSAGMTRLDQAVLKCLATWRYAPARQKGRPVTYFLQGSVLMQQPPIDITAFSAIP